jgi:hypothetical protein
MSPTVGQVGQYPARQADGAIVAAQALENIILVENVGAVDAQLLPALRLGAKIRNVVAQRGVDQHIGRDFKRIRLIAEYPTEEVHAGADLQAFERKVRDLYSPQSEAECLGMPVGALFRLPLLLSVFSTSVKV